MTDPDTDPRPVASATAEPPFPAPGFAVAAPSRRERLRGPLLTAGIVGALTIGLHLRDPHVSGSWGGCPWLALTGHHCPGCGALRAVNDLTNGDLVGAASSNLLFVLAVPLLVLWWLRWTGRAWSGAERPVRAPAARQLTGVWIALFTVVMVVFGVLRNTSWGSWLAP